MFGLDLGQIFGFFISFVFALSVHEWAHAFAAKKYGDDTAESQGRLTLNPLPHIDPIGTILLPILGAVSNFPLLGWAKPVPVNPNNIRGDQRTAMMVISFAGPLSNMVLCFCSAGLFLFLQQVDWNTVPNASFFIPLISLFFQFAFVNAILAFFNLVPLEPLDGADVLRGLLPANRELIAGYDSLQSYAMPAFILLFVMGGFFWIGPVAMGFLELCQSAWGLVL